MTTLSSATGRTVVSVDVSPIGEVTFECTRNGQTIERLNYGREQDISPTHRLQISEDGRSVTFFDDGPDGERVVKTIPVEGPNAPAPAEEPAPVAETPPTPEPVADPPPAENLSGEAPAA